MFRTGPAPVEGRVKVRGACLVAMLVASGCAFGDASRRRSMLSELAEWSREDAVERERTERTLTGAHLEREDLVRAVVARNPRIEAARAAWRAALERQPQEVALPDPMVEYAIAPLSIGSQSADLGQTISVSQRFPFPGRLELRSAVAIAEAAAEREQVAVVRQELALMAALLYDHLYVAERALEVNDHHRLLFEQLERAALALYTAGTVSQQDPIQARLERARIAQARIALEERRATLRAQINGLLHREPDAPIPPTPALAVTPDVEVPPVDALVRIAVAQRPELRVIAERIEARRAARSLAEHEYFPDFGVMASYNSMWRMVEHQFMVGVSVEVPIQLDARAGAVSEAEARIAEQEALRESELDEVRVEVETARQQAIAARRTLALHHDVLLPLARQQIEAARAGYQTGRGSFQGVIDAERSLREIELGWFVAQAQLRQALARLQRAVGVMPGSSDLAAEVDGE